MVKENNSPLPFNEIEVDPVIEGKGDSEMAPHINPSRMGFLLGIEPRLMDRNSPERLDDSKILSRATTDWIVTQERKKVYSPAYEASVRRDFEQTLKDMRENPAIVEKYIADQVQRNRPIPNVVPRKPPLSKNYTGVQYAAEAMERTHDHDPGEEQ